MPSDNLEKLFREKVEEVQHTPPPQFSWTPDKSWNQLQPLLPAKRRKSTASFYLGVAAGLVLALLAGLSLYRISRPETSAASVVASTGKLPVKSLGKIAELPEDNLGESRTLLPNSKPGAIAVAKSTRNTLPTSTVAAQAALAPEKEMKAASTYQEKEPESAAQPAQLTAVAPAASAQPLKITVVLGARTLARAEALAQETMAVSETNLLAQEKPKKKKLRLRIHHPDTGLQTDTQLATIKPFQSDIGLGARIKF